MLKVENKSLEWLFQLEDLLDWHHGMWTMPYRHVAIWLLAAIDCDTFLLWTSGQMYVHTIWFLARLDGYSPQEDSYKDNEQYDIKLLFVCSRRQRKKRVQIQNGIKKRFSQLSVKVVSSHKAQNLVCYKQEVKATNSASQKWSLFHFSNGPALINCN